MCLTNKSFVNHASYEVCSRVFYSCKTGVVGDGNRAFFRTGNFIAIALGLVVMSVGLLTALRGKRIRFYIWLQLLLLLCNETANMFAVGQFQVAMNSIVTVLELVFLIFPIVLLIESKTEKAKEKKANKKTEKDG